MNPVLANVLQPLIDVFEEVLVFFHDQVGFGWGFSIVALTLSVRLLLLPLTLKQARSMQAMQRIAPKMKELQARHKDDRQRLNQEMMKLYQEHKVNPFASCLPLVAQLPVFIALFYMLQGDLRREICPEINPGTTGDTKPCGSTDASQFLFIPDITDKAVGVTLIALIVLYVASQLASSVLMSLSADRNQRLIFMALPFVFIPFVIGFPAGLLVYWITTNLWTVVQQLIVRRTVGPLRMPTMPDGPGKDEGDGKGRRSPIAARPAASGAAAAAGGGAGGAPRRTSAPPPPPSKRKKKRSGRRR